MKKICITSLISFIFVFISSLMCYLLRYVSLNKSAIVLGIGIGIIILDIILYFIFRKWFYVNFGCLFIGSIALGFAIRAWYLYRGFDNDLLIMTLISLCSVLHLFIFFLLSKVPLFNKHSKLFPIIYILLSLIIYIIIVCNTKTTFISTFGYYMIVQLAFIVASLFKTDNVYDLIENVTKTSFFAVAIILLIILIIISEGDIDFGFDLPDLSFSSKKKKK